MPVVEFTVSDEDVESSTTEKKESTFGPGNYTFVVMEATLGKSKVKETPRLEMKFFVEHDDRDFTMFDDVYLTEGSKWRYSSHKASRRRKVHEDWRILFYRSSSS